MNTRQGVSLVKDGMEIEDIYKDYDDELEDDSISVYEAACMRGYTKDYSD